MKSQPSLAIIDWGIGGIGLYARLKALRPHIAITYFSDTGAVPYGRMSRPELVARLEAVIAHLRAQGTTHLLIGCNAASTAIPFLDDGDITIEGVIESALSLTLQMKPTSLALIGGRRTVLSGAYRRAFANHGIPLRQRIAQPLSARIESGDISSAELRGECRKILGPIRDCSHLLLACTHYPAITPLLSEHLSADTIIIDPAGELASRASCWKIPDGGTDRFLTTGNPAAMKLAAENAFGVVVERVGSVVVEETARRRDQSPSGLR